MAKPLKSRVRVRVVRVRVRAVYKRTFKVTALYSNAFTDLQLGKNLKDFFF